MGLRFPECSGVTREGRGEGTVGRRSCWFAVAAAAIVPAPRVSVGVSAPGRGLGRRSRAPGRLEPQLRVPGRPLPSAPPPAARSRAGPGPCVARGSASRRSSEAAAGGNTERQAGRQAGVYQGHSCTWQVYRTELGQGLFLWFGPP